MKHLAQTLKWVLAVRGVIAILFGLAALFVPGLNIQILVLIFGITILVDGFVNSIGSIQSRKDIADWWVYLLEGAFSILLGSITVFWPNITGVSLLVIISVWAIVTGVGKMVAAIGLRKLIEGELVLLFSGILSVIFGFIMLTFPQATAINFAAVIGFYNILLGIFLLSLAWRIREEHDTVHGDFLAPDNFVETKVISKKEEAPKAVVISKPVPAAAKVTKPAAKTAAKPKTTKTVTKKSK